MDLFKKPDEQPGNTGFRPLWSNKGDEFIRFFYTIITMNKFRSLLLLSIAFCCLCIPFFSGCVDKEQVQRPSPASPADKEVSPMPDSSTVKPEISPSPIPVKKGSQGDKTDVEGMVFIPGGTFTMGSNEPNSLPETKVTLDSFYMDIYPVTWKDFARFEKETGYKCRADEMDEKFRKPDVPVTMVTYEDAAQYAKWAGKRLPTEAELEAAARGSEGRIYTWGNKWDESNLEKASKGPHRVGQYPGSDSVYGVKDLTGNIFHWTIDRVTDFKDPKTSWTRIIKAGAWTYFPRWNKASFRAMYPEKEYSYFIGFRCVKPGDEENDPNLKQVKQYNKGELPDQEQFETDDDIMFLFRPQMWPIRTLSQHLEKQLKLLKKGQTVADIGCGLGYLSYRFLPHVGSTGKVYAVDISESSIEFIRVYIKKENIHNLVPVLSKPDNISLPADSCDVIFLMGTIHCLSPDSIIMPFYNSCYKALKKGGRMIITETAEFKNNPERIKMIPKAGFKEVGRDVEYGETMVIYEK